MDEAAGSGQDDGEQPPQRRHPAGLTARTLAKSAVRTGRHLGGRVRLPWGREAAVLTLPGGRHGTGLREGTRWLGPALRPVRGCAESLGAPGWLSPLSVCLISAQVMISQFVSLSPPSGSALTAWDPLSAPLPLECELSLSL